MNIKKPLLRWSVAVLAVLTLTACGSTTSSPTTPSPTIGDSAITSLPATGESVVQKAQTGQVTFAVQFPQAALKKALMDNRTVAIKVEWSGYENPSVPGSVTLTPDGSGLATATVAVPTGNMRFTALAQDNNFVTLDMASSSGEITTGNNTVYLTFLSGDWQFVDANDNLLPQSFGATTLAGFSLQAGQNYAGDPSNPRSGTDYQLQWQSGTIPATTFTPIGPLMEGGQEAQFNAPAATGSSFRSDWLNITDPARSDSLNSHNNNGPSTNNLPGDRVVWIMNWKDGDGPATITDANNVDLIPGFRTAGDSQVLDGSHLGGHLLAMTFENLTSTQLATNVDCNAVNAQQATPAAARAAAIKASLTQTAGKAAVGDETTLTAGTATVQYTDCYEDHTANQIDGDNDGNFYQEQLTFDANGNRFYDAGDSFYDIDGDGRWDYSYYPGTSYDVTEQYSNVTAREFRAKGSQAGSVYTPPAPPVQASAVGTWMKIDPATNYAAILSFFADGTYMEGEYGSQTPGIEVGTYSYDSATSITTFNVIQETNGVEGPATVGNPSAVQILDLTANTLTFYDPTGNVTLNRVVSNPANPIIGTWGNLDPATGEGVVMTFLGDGSYMFSQTTPADAYGQPGNEWGTYSWGSTTGTFTAGVTGDLNGEWGFSHPQGTPRLTISRNVATNQDELTMEELDGLGNVLFTATIPRMY
jgi:hypothetical protein